MIGKGDFHAKYHQLVSLIQCNISKIAQSWLVGFYTNDLHRFTLLLVPFSALNHLVPGWPVFVALLTVLIMWTG